MPTFKKNTGKTIQEAFDKFHYDNPQVYKHFKRLAIRAIKVKKKSKLSSKMIVNVIRWEIFMETQEATLFTDKLGVQHKFKINDAYTSRYARLFIKEHPQYSTIFNCREIRSM